MLSFLKKMHRQKFSPVLLPVFFIVLIFLFCSAFYYKTNHSFVSFADRMFRSEIVKNTMDLHYTLEEPETLSITPAEVSLGSCHPDALRESYAVLDSYAQEMEKIPSLWLSSKNRLTYDILKTYFSVQSEEASYLLYDEPLGASLGTNAQLPILLAEYSFSSKKDVTDYLKLLAKLPAYYDSILQFERKKSAAGLFMSPENADGIISQCHAFLDSGDENILFTTFDSRLEKLTELTEKERKSYQAQNRLVIKNCVLPAYQSLADGIETLKSTCKNELGLCYLPEGRQYYACLVRSTTGCFDDIETIFKRIQKQLTSDIHSLRAIIEKNPQLLEEAGEEKLTLASASVSSEPKEILTELSEKISDEFPVLPSMNYEIKFIEPALQDYLSPAF